MKAMQLISRLCGIVMLFALPAVLRADDIPTSISSVADSASALVNRVVDKSASFAPLTLLPGDHLPFSNIAYNRADGLFLGIGSDKRQALRLLDTAFLAHISVGYSFGSHYWQATGGLARRFGARSFGAVVGGEAHHYTDSRDAWKIPDWENSLHAFFAREDYLTRFRRTGWSVYWEQFFARGMLMVASYGGDIYEPLGRNVSWSLFGGDKEFPENISFEKSALHTLTIALRYSTMPRLQRAGGGVRISAQGEKIWGDNACERWLAEAALHQPIGKTLTLNSRVRLGSVAGGGFEPLLFAIGGPGSLPGFRLNEFGGNRMALLNTELLLHGTAFMGGRVAESLSLILSCDIGYAASVPESDALWKGLLPGQISGLKTSIGAAIGSANGVLRIGAAWRTEGDGTPSLVVRFSPAIRVLQ